MVRSLAQPVLSAEAVRVGSTVSAGKVKEVYAWAAAPVPSYSARICRYQVSPPACRMERVSPLRNSCQPFTGRVSLRVQTNFCTVAFCTLTAALAVPSVTPLFSMEMTGTLVSTEVSMEPPPEEVPVPETSHISLMQSVPSMESTRKSEAAFSGTVPVK